VADLVGLGHVERIVGAHDHVVGAIEPHQLGELMRRSMPYPIPKTLTSDELYALSAYILFLNKIVGEDEVMDANSLPRVKMPNRDNFVVWDQDKIEYDPIRMGAPR